MLSKTKYNRNIFPLIVAAAVFVLTLLAWYLSYRSINLQERQRFEYFSNQIEHEVVSRMETYINALEQARSMFFVTKEVDREEFRRYVHSLKILERYPGIQGIGFTQRILSQNLAQHIAKIKGQGFDNYSIWPTHPRKEYFSIIYLEPFNWRNKRALGYDMFTEPVRQMAMARARDTGNATMSGIVSLVQETKDEPQPGFLIYVPVYSRAATSSMEERRSNLIGFIYSPFRAIDLFHQVFSRLDVPLGIEIYSGTRPGPNSLLYGKNQRSSVTNESFKFIKDKQITIAEQPWIIRSYSLPIPEDQNVRHLPVVILFLGTIVSWLIYWVISRQITHSLIEQERSEQLETLNQVGRTLSAELDLTKLIQSVTDAGRELTGARMGAFFYHSPEKKDAAPVLYALSGLVREDLQEFPAIEKTPLFSAIFNGTSTILSDDIIHDPLYGKDLPFLTLPHHPLSVRSFLAVPVISAYGKSLGAIVYGHENVGVFKDKEQRLIEGMAAQAAIGIDNAQLYKKANDAIAARDEFLSVASHELKTPITSLKLQFQIAMKMIQQGNEKVFSKEAVIKRVSKATTQLERMNKLIDEMLDSSRVSLSKMTFNMEALDLRQLTEEVLEHFHLQLDLLKIALHFNKCDLPAMVFADKYRMEQVISNLVSNAIKYGDQKPISVTIGQDDKSVFLAVKDHGMGIAPENFDVIFERFERAVSGKNISGLGLGLFISNRIVKAHAGKIELNSELGKGSEFKVILPKHAT